MNAVTTNFINRLLGASDIVQQSMLEAQLDFDRFSGTSEVELRSWLVKIVENNLIDSARRFRHTQQRDVLREVSLDASSIQREIAATQKTGSSIVWG